MVDSLAEVRKYRLALDGERLAYASFMGSSDWEDYASLSFTAMQAEALTDIDMRLEALTAAVVHVDRRLARIVELLEASAGVGAEPTGVDVGRVIEEALGRASREARQEAEAEVRAQAERERRAAERRERPEVESLSELLSDPEIAREARDIRRIYGREVCVSFLKRRASELGMGEIDVTEDDLPDTL